MNISVNYSLTYLSRPRLVTKFCNQISQLPIRSVHLEKYLLKSFRYNSDIVWAKRNFSPRIFQKNYKLYRSKSIQYNENILLRYIYTSAFRFSTLPIFPDSKVERFNISEEIIEEDFLTASKWDTIIAELSSSNRFLQPVFDTFIINKCLKKNNASLAISYVDYLETKNEILNFVAMSFYAILLAKNIEKVDENKFLNVYQILKAEQYLPENITINIIEALSLTRYWKDSLNYLKLFERPLSNISENSLNKSHNLIIRAIIRNEGVHDAYNYIKLLGNKTGPNNTEIFVDEDTVIELLSVIKISNEVEKHNQLSILFGFLQKREGSITKNTSDILCEIVPRNWKSLRTTIANRKTCKCCGGKLTPVPLSQEAFNKLKEACEERALKGMDIFQSTTPKEWENFLRFLKRYAPFEIIIDGLNVIYMNNFKEQQIRNIILSTCQRYKKGKVLMIIRKHMKKTLISSFGSLDALPNLKFFFVENITKDDAFILYASMYSGLGCKFITRDYLRNHKFVMGDPVLRKQFRNWQNLHQMLIFKKQGRVLVKEPYQYHRIPQWIEDTGSWHIPVETGEERDYIDSCEDWLCLKLPEQSK